MNIDAIQNGIVPSNYGWANQMEDGITPVAHCLSGQQLHHVMCNSFGFGGNDSSIILSRHEA